MMEETELLPETAWKKVIKMFLNEKTPEEYDFKLMQGYNGKSSVDKWFAYKTLKDGFDCDTCELAKAIYHCLWGWEMESGNSFRRSPLFQKNLGEGAGGDTMNSLGTTMEKYMNKRGVKQCKVQWEKEEAGKKAEEIGLENFAKYTSCIGNFVLVPARFNGHRGIHPYIKDYWDLSLDYLAYEEKSAWLSMYKEPMNQKNAGDNKAFVKYINMFFLWDYVEKDYEVRPLFASHKDILGRRPLSRENLFPKIEGDKNEFQEFFNNVNMYIKRRGIFMAAMLKIAIEFRNAETGLPDNKEDWSGWDVSVIYKYIVEKVFLADKTYSGYKEIFKAIEGAIENITKGKTLNDILDILKKAQKEIGKAGRCQ